MELKLWRNKVMEYTIPFFVVFLIGFIFGFYVGRLKRRQYQKAGNNATQIQIFKED